LGDEDIPQGLKPPFFVAQKRPKAEALGYLDATATATAKSKYNSIWKSRSPSGMTNKRSSDNTNDNSNSNGNSKGNDNSRSLRDDKKSNCNCEYGAVLIAKLDGFLF
jgi:hypothetical protein